MIDASTVVMRQIQIRNHPLFVPIRCRMDPYPGVPDVRDGLTREERLVLHVLDGIQRERGERNVPTAQLWGHVCEHFYITPEDLAAMLARLGARR
jgi:hypothetical protein